VSTISVQVSLYPLRQPHLGATITSALQIFRSRGLEVNTGTMSTVIAGESDAVFDSLKASFESAAAAGDVVMVASISNCCPARIVDRQSAAQPSPAAPIGGR
jgi:uncharacterized protein YqgV (UPF0045/DUF77 family)